MTIHQLIDRLIEWWHGLPPITDGHCPSCDRQFLARVAVGDRFHCKCGATSQVIQVGGRCFTLAMLGFRNTPTGR